MNRIALLILASLTGLGAAYSIWLHLGADDATTTGTLVRAVVAVAVGGAAGLITGLAEPVCQGVLLLKRARHPAHLKCVRTLSSSE